MEGPRNPSKQESRKARFQSEAGWESNKMAAQGECRRLEARRQIAGMLHALDELQKPGHGRGDESIDSMCNS